jgi:murein DD-endopeptidase MepM/ murein hydrolase activator NlpD
MLIKQKQVGRKKSTFRIKLSKRLVLCFFTLFFSSFSIAQNTYPKFIYESMNDSMDLANSFYDCSDSLSHLFSASDLYEEWATDKVYFKEKDLSEMEDSLHIILTYGDHYYTHPFKGQVTSKFGWRRYRYHYGMDINLNTGDTVLAAFDGVVRFAEYNKGGFGNVVVIRHINGIETLYAHLSKILVDTNQIIKSGEIIGLGGNTGHSYGSHLHFETRFLGNAFDPEKIIDFQTFSLNNDTLKFTKNDFNYLKKYKSSSVSAPVVTDGNAIYHVVRRGDTLSGIAVRYGSSISRLCQLNGISRNTVLQLNQKIRVK